jgi:hypothetical protein
VRYALGVKGLTRNTGIVSTSYLTDLRRRTKNTLQSIYFELYAFDFRKTERFRFSRTAIQLRFNVSPCYNGDIYPIVERDFNLLAPELVFFLILAHPVYKMCIIQEPITLEL